MTCLQAYETLSNQLIEAEGELGLEEAVERFPYASLTTFLDLFHGAMLRSWRNMLRS